MSVDHGTPPLVVETLERGLSRHFGRPVHVRGVRRDRSSRCSSFRTERMQVTTDGPERELDVYFKDLHPRHQVTRSWALRRIDRAPSRRELGTYESVLSPGCLGTPVLYGARWEPEHERCWLFLEDVGDRLLQGEHDLGPWLDACRWLARFQASTRALPAERTDWLPVRDEGHYRRCAEHVEVVLPILDSADRDVVRRALEDLGKNAGWLNELPRCVIHGQLFGQNVMLRGPSSAHRIAVIDWETASVGPRAFDLASLTSNKRGKEQRRAMRRAYVDEYGSVTGETLGWEDFEKEFRATAVLHALEWLLWWARHPEGRRRFAKHVRELRWLLDGDRELVALPRPGHARA